MLKEVNTLQTKAIHTLQEEYAKLSRASEDTNRGLNQVLEEKHHSKREIIFINQNLEDLYKYMKKLFNVYQNRYPQAQGNVQGNITEPYKQEDIKPNAQLESRKRSP
ncbi:hypothetical protein O181_075869 [Austropuccinia psidii MF-1]|uniref:Uncharacterized protein n=1 Tax=Austropuccinia psidii MF-1 TaxID=1389203 RepID=A0A9Q3IEV9_9BASI|nr:hypothetical protein [Austropuccinia psidii MF-1]